MIKVKETTKFPLKAKGLLLVDLLILIVVVSAIFSISGNTNFFGIFLVIVIIFGLPFYIYITLVYNSRSFVVNDDNITINSGIFVKKSKMIPFKMIQSINRKQGIFAGMFGITTVDIWTSSPSQININDGNTTNRPDGSIILTDEDANWLLKFIPSSSSSR